MRTPQNLLKSAQLRNAAILRVTRHNPLLLYQNTSFTLIRNEQKAVKFVKMQKSCVCCTKKGPLRVHSIAECTR